MRCPQLWYIVVLIIVRNQGVKTMKLKDKKRVPVFNGLNSANKGTLSREALYNLDLGDHDPNIEEFAEYTEETDWKDRFPVFAPNGVGTVFIMFDKNGEAIRVGGSRNINGSIRTLKYGRGEDRTQIAERRAWKEAASAIFIFMKKQGTEKHLKKDLLQNYNFRYNVKRSNAV